MAATLQELARLAGVSHTTVSLVLRGAGEGRVGEATRKRILRIARAQGYRANVAARGLVQGRTYRVAVCIHDFLDRRSILWQFSFYDALARLLRRIHGAGYTIELVEVDPQWTAGRVVDHLAGKGVDGHVFVGWERGRAQEVLSGLQNRGRHAVAIGTTLAAEDLIWSDVDRAGAIRKAARNLFAEGHSRVVLLDVDEGGQHRRAKIDAFSGAVREQTGRDAGPWVFRMESAGLSEVVRVTQEACASHEDVSAFLLTDNFYADAVLLELNRLGFAPGADRRLVGFGDTALASRTTPRLTHYSLMVDEQVRFAFEGLMGCLEGDATGGARHRLFDSVLVQGET